MTSKEEENAPVAGARGPTPSITLAAALVCVGLSWLTDILWSPFSESALRVIVGISLASAGFALVRIVFATWRGLPPLDGAGERDRTAGRALLALVAVTLVARFAGLDFELIDHYHNDEGVFFAEAKRINSGRVLPGQFNYPHLLFYLSAVTMWLVDLLPDAMAWLPSRLYGLETESEIRRILLRMISASFGTLTTIPVFLAGRRIAGLAAGTIAGLLITFSPVYNEIAHLVIADVPSGFFAALTLFFVSRLLDSENYPDYLWAGVSAALAATSKYPAGVCAVAIVGIWLYWRVKQRNFTLHLVASGVVSLSTFLAVMPALWLRLDDAFAGRGKDVAFGYRQYAELGWTGVVKDSNPAWYLGQLVTSFGILALVAGGLGLLFLRAPSRTRALGVALYPVVYLWLIFSMNMVVKRNLQPVLPALALLLGVGLSAWTARVPRRSIAAVLVALTVAAPAYRLLRWDVSRMRVGTAQMAKAWLEENVPQGVGILREAYTPRLDRQRYATYNIRYAARVPLPRVFDGSLDYLLLAKNAFGRFEKGPETLRKEHQREYAERYRRLRSLELVHEWEPGPWRAGPHLFLYRIDPDAIDYRTARRFEAIEAAYFSHPEIRPSDDLAGPIVYQRQGQSVVFKDYFEAGEYRIVLESPTGETIDGDLYVVSRDNEEVGSFAVRSGTTVRLPDRGKYLFRVFLPGGPLAALRVEPTEAL